MIALVSDLCETLPVLKKSHPQWFGKSPMPKEDIESLYAHYFEDQVHIDFMAKAHYVMHRVADYFDCHEEQAFHERIMGYLLMVEIDTHEVPKGKGLGSSAVFSILLVGTIFVRL